MFDYEELLHQQLLHQAGTIQDKHLFIKKATGIGYSKGCMFVH